MKLLADENIEAEIVDALRKAGHAISDIKETSPGLEDTNVLKIAGFCRWPRGGSNKREQVRFYRQIRTTQNRSKIRLGSKFF